MKSQYSKIKYTYDTLSKKNLPQKLIPGIFLYITMSLLSFYLFNWVKACDRIRLRSPSVLAEQQLRIYYK